MTLIKQGKRVIVPYNASVDGNSNNLYIDTSVSPNVMYYWDGTQYNAWGGEQVATEITDLLTDGNIIGTYLNEAGTEFEIKESIVKVKADSDIFGNYGFAITNEAGVKATITQKLDETDPNNVKVQTLYDGDVIFEFPLYTVNNDIHIDNSGSEWDLTDDKITILETNGDSQVINFPYRSSVVVNPDGSIDILQNGVVLGTVPAQTFFKEQKQFHVDKNGDDLSGIGADEKPYQTITKALSVATQATAVVPNEGSYNEVVTIATQNLTLRGSGDDYGTLTELMKGVFVTANGTSVRVSSITTSTVDHSGTSPLYLSNSTLNSNYTSTTTAYSEIKESRIQEGTISKTAAGILFITDSLIGNANFATANSIISLRNVVIDAGKAVTIGAGVIYSLQDVVGVVNINAGAIPLKDALLAQGATALQAKLQECSTFNDIRLTNVETITTATKMLVRDADGIVREQVFSSGLPSGGTDGQVLTVQPDGSYAWENLPTSTQLFHQRDVFNSTDGQTTFTLSATPIGDTEKVHVTRNGIDISDAFTWVDGVGTYDPAENYGCVLDANDKLIFHYESN